MTDEEVAAVIEEFDANGDGELSLGRPQGGIDAALAALQPGDDEGDGERASGGDEGSMAKLQPPGIEPGSPAWQASIIPLDHGCS